ncbi:MAG: epoxyqueuosine reductase [Candidatus Lokiarchaeota archaeon]|nr:epoxyqueuosine reductase [Candidatus Lokiarchaeota archaeon]
MSLNEELEQKLKELGAIRVGFVTLETLAGGPEGANLKYLLPSAESAVCWAIPLQKDLIRPYLGKTHPNARGDHEKDNIEVNIKSSKMSRIIAQFLVEKGCEAASVIANNKYREDVLNWNITLPPEISLRYLAVRSGVASFGWSGNVGIKEYGTAIILGATITNAKFDPTDPIPAEESFCNECKICTKVCAFQMFSPDEKVEITLGGHIFSYSKRVNKLRCILTCGGFNGLHKSRKFSTFSPGRYDYPETAMEVRRVLTAAMTGQRKRPLIKDSSTGYIPASFSGGKGASSLPTEETKNDVVQLTCGNCQIICWGDPKDTAKNYKILVNSGCVIQREDGRLEVFPPDEAIEEFEKMPLKRQRWYRKDYKMKMRQITRPTEMMP